jgi:hypothetical protein
VRTRFTAVTGFLATACLLGSSASAFAPEFDSDLPTVIITDKLANPVDLSAPYDNNGVGAPATEYTFRFSKAFALQDYVALNGNTFNQLKYFFNEYPNSDPLPNSPNDKAEGVLLINGNQAYASGSAQIPDDAAFTASGISAVDRYTDGGLDFRNRDFSGDDEGVNAGFDAIGGVTGYNIDLSGPQERVVELYLQGNTSTDIEVGTFLVITSREGTDSLSESLLTDPFTSIYDVDDLAGYDLGLLGGLEGIPSSAADTAADGWSSSNTLDDSTSTAGFSRTPNVGTAPANTDTISMAATAAQIGLGTVNLTAANSGVSFAANKLYRLRANIYSPNTATNDIVRMSFGGAATSGLATVSFNSTTNITNNPPTLSSSPTNMVDAYLLSEGAGAAQITFDIVPTGGGADFTLGSVAIAEADVADLGSANVVLNQGGTVPAKAAGEIQDPIASPDPFDLSGTPAWAASHLNSAATWSSSLTANQLTFTWAADGTNVINDYSPRDFSNLTYLANFTDADAAQAFTVDDGKIYVMDVWVSTPATKSYSGGMPVFQPSVTNAITFGAWTTFTLDSVDFLSQPTNTGVQTAPRAYSVVWKPQTGKGTANAAIQIIMLSTGNYYTSASTLNLHRVTVREYIDPSP